VARALDSILTELNSVYNPQRQAQTDLYNQNLSALDPQQQADLSGLEAAKKDSFGQIETGANRRGMFFSGIPLQEQAKYVGQTYLPAVANLQGKYAQIRGNLKDSLANILANINTEQRKFGQGIYQDELNREEERRQFNEQIAAQERNAAASRASAGSGFSPTPEDGAPTGGNQNNALGVNTAINDLTGFFEKNYKSSAGAGATRAQQLNWVNNWATQRGFDPNNIQGVSSQWILDTYFPADKYAPRPATPKPAPTPIIQLAQSQMPRNGTPTSKLPF
jgi:uncharacterized phage infection (PIP) family protein YhgE